MFKHSQPIPHQKRESRHHPKPDSRHSVSSQKHERRVEIYLLDLDGLRESLKIGIKETSQLTHISNFLKRRFKAHDEPVSENARITYFWGSQCLLGENIPSIVSTLHYRVYNCSDDDDSIRITWSKELQLEGSQVHQIHCALGKGSTVGELRQVVASLLGLQDPNRIIISSRGGLRPGPVQGNNWEACKITAWLCRIIWIDVAPSKAYLVLRGMNEEYLYHQPTTGSGHWTGFRLLRNWIKTGILTNCDVRLAGGLKVDKDDITLICEGKVLDKRMRISDGQTVDFHLPHAVAEKFHQEEAWLVPLTESCSVCGDEKRISEMPRQITQACDHAPNTCNDCVGQWITSSMETVAWDRLKCPECPQTLLFDDVKTFANPQVFDRYDALATKASLSGIRDFRWCLNPRRTHKLRKNEKASEKKVKEITKACPQCHKDVYKYSGCDHITCVCGHEWCYICLEAYYHDRNSFLRCKHKRDCEYYENPPIYEGGRAFMPMFNPANMNRGNGPHPQPHPPWMQRPGPAGQVPLRPRSPPPPRHVQPHARNDPRGINPWVIMEGFLEHGENAFAQANRTRHEPGENDFLGAAAMFNLFDLDQQMRRTQ
ncbi:hypothetical protein JX265_005442 [Neoarthrinium moseri]|uniref:RING-type domain-containing protein n=1 Tax=Neoarthrinium moseri TaxID=1658444 RepID=A0A9P9WP98_9PEZI|nr:hypothetical protein JX265_005442 [Neoarthrinium moseri]